MKTAKKSIKEKKIALPAGLSKQKPAPAAALGNPLTDANKEKGQVCIRMYRQGLGDCFLLTFKGMDKVEKHIVIDCGVLRGSKRIDLAVNDIKIRTGGVLELLIATHEHADHLSGFNSARDVWQDMSIKHTWLGWLENESLEDAKKIKSGQRAKLRSALAGLYAMQKLAGVQGQNSKVASIEALLSFSLDEDDISQKLLFSAPGNALAGSGGLEPLGRDIRAAAASDQEGTPSVPGPARALAWLKERAGTEITYCDPEKKPLSIPGIPNVKAFVLGPPRSSLLGHSEPSSGEAYELFQSGLSSTDYFFQSALAAAGNTIRQDSSPFDRYHQRHFGDGSFAENFIISHYGKDESHLQAWRRIENDWLGVTETLSLQLTGAINNTSLALAFELGEGGPVLLFPGDAQAGSWASWSDLKWEIKEAGKPERTVTGPDLLRRTVFYKVGHHGSHNATMKAKGLELMEHPDLVAFIPVNQATAQNQNPKWMMPWEPMFQELKKRTRQRVILSDEDMSQASQMALPDVLKNVQNGTQFWDTFVNSVQWDNSDEALWVEYTVK